jgi:hypothetical protein
MGRSLHGLGRCLPIQSPLTIPTGVYTLMRTAKTHVTSRAAMVKPGKSSRHVTCAIGYHLSNPSLSFWFSNGCDIGSSTCDGNSGQPIPCCNKKFVYVGSGDPPPWSDENILVDPTWVKTFNRSAYRPKHIAYPDRKATVCDPRLRTLNTAAECGSRADFWVSGSMGQAESINLIRFLSPFRNLRFLSPFRNQSTSTMRLGATLARHLSW